MPQATGYEKQYPTRGDLAREQVRRRGIPYYQDVQAEIGKRLERLAPACRGAFAVACVNRLMKRHEQLPMKEQLEFTLGQRPVLAAMWLGLHGLSVEATQKVRESLAAFHSSPYDHDQGQDGPNDADEHAAA